MKKRKYLAVLFFLCSALFSIYKLYQVIYPYYIAQEIYEEIEVYLPIQSKEEIDFVALQQINPDIFAWISIPNTNISYPIVQSSDNEYYLYRLIDKTWNKSGSIYLDYRNTQTFTDPHSILYGHHMKDGTMFAELMKYKEQNFYNENPVYTITTPEKILEVHIFAAYNVFTNDTAWQMDISGPHWLKNTIQRSLITSKELPTNTHNILTLSTCDYNQVDERFVVVGYIK